MDCKCFNSFFAVVILVFSFWNISYSKWIIVAAAALILIEGIWTLAKHGCSCNSCGIGKKTGSNLLMEKSGDEVEAEPSEEEVKEVMKKEVKPKKEKK